MTTPTKAELLAENAALREEINTLRAALINVTDVASQVNTIRARPAYEMPQWQKDRAAAMAAAKQAAMAKHCVVAV